MSATDGQWVDVFAAEMLRRLLLFFSFMFSLLLYISVVSSSSSFAF